MNSKFKCVLAGTALTGLLGLAGCEADYYPDAYPAAEYAMPYPAGYDVYYYGGWYDGPNWYWRDRYGHIYHERRQDHEVRVQREHFDQRAIHGAYEGRAAHPGPGPAHEGHPSAAAHGGGGEHGDGGGHR